MIEENLLEGSKIKSTIERVLKCSAVQRFKVKNDPL